MNWIALLLCPALSLGFFSETWQDKANRRIESIRKDTYTLTVLMPNGQPASNLAFYIKQTRHHFHFGTCVNSKWLESDTPDAQKYKDFILEHFNTIVPENELRWSFIEPEKGKKDFSQADKILSFAERNQLKVRGHCLLWGVQSHIQPWVKFLSPHDLKESMIHHLEITVPRYSGRFIAWDVFNELIDGTFYNDILGDKNIYWFFQKVQKLDPHTPLFLNEYGIFASEEKQRKYFQLAQHLLQNDVPLGGLGIQEHSAERFAFLSSDVVFSTDAENVPFHPDEILKCLDFLSKTRIPIYLSELSFRDQDEQRKATALENCFRLAFSHPNVDGIILWGFWEKSHWLGREASLIDENWNYLPAGDTLHNLLTEEWNTAATEVSNDEGEIKFRGFFGEYYIESQLPNGEKLIGTAKLTPSQKTARITLNLVKKAQPIPETPLEDSTEETTLEENAEKAPPDETPEEAALREELMDSDEALEPSDMIQTTPDEIPQINLTE